MTSKLSSTIISSFFLILFLIGFVVLAFTLKSLLLLFFLAFILASAMNPIVTGLQKKKFPRPVAIILLYTVLLSFLGVLIAAIAPPLVEQSGQLFLRISSLLSLPPLTIDGILTLDFAALAGSVDNYGSLFQQLQGSLNTILDIIFSTFSAVFVTFTLLLVTFYFLLDMQRVAAIFAWMLPGNKSEKIATAKELLTKIQIQLGGWVRGQLALMFLIGVVTYIGLTLLGVPYALPLALLAGLLEIVPNLGPTIASLPAIMIAFLMVNPVIGGATIVFYLVVQQFENNLIVPVIMKESVNVRPLTTIILILSGFELLGVVGGLLSVPLYITVRTIWQQLRPNQGPFMDFSDLIDDPHEHLGHKE
jgi:predicted PurR-regulated permease PerM